MTWVDSTTYSAICDDWIIDYPWGDNPCPKGWGKNKGRHDSDTYSAQNAQGHINDNSTPIYNTVTKYRDTVYNYITTRVAKA